MYNFKRFNCGPGDKGRSTRTTTADKLSSNTGPGDIA